MIRAWRLADGRYRLEAETEADGRRARAAYSRYGEGWSVREDQLDDLGAEKVFGVVTGPSSCGCEPVQFRWVTESEVKAGKTDARMMCRTCLAKGDFAAGLLAPPHQCDIVDVCGEADEAEAVYLAEFSHRIEAPT